MSEQQTTTTNETTTTVAPKDDFKLASDVSENTETTEVVEVAAAAEAVETEEIEHAEEHDDVEETEALDASKKDEGKKKKGGFQRRVDKLTREKAEIQRELEMARAEAAALKVQKPAVADDKVTKKVAPSSDEPKPEDFSDVTDYYRALAKHEFKQEQIAAKAAEREESARQELTKQRQTHLDRMKEFEKTHADFNDAMENIRNVNAHQNIHDAIMKSDLGPALMYELANKPEEFAKIVAMDPVDGVRAIGKLEAKLEATSSAGKETTLATETVPAKKVTTAPKPISTISSKVGTTPSIRDNRPYDEWVQIRNAELRNR